MSLAGESGLIVDLVDDLFLVEVEVNLTRRRHGPGRLGEVGYTRTHRVAAWRLLLGELSMAEEATPTTPAGPPNGSAEPARRMPDGHPATRDQAAVACAAPARPISGSRSAASSKVDGSLARPAGRRFRRPPRAMLGLACSTHVAFMAEVTALKTEPAASLEIARRVLRDQAAALKLADQALAAIRVETGRRSRLRSRARRCRRASREDLAGRHHGRRDQDLVARAQPDRARLSAVEKAINSRRRQARGRGASKCPCSPA